jgi:4-cresol dehydrogenase (hydroxylating)
MIGNALEHGVGHTPMRDHFDAHCGMEVVLPNGELLRTGMGALPGSRSWQTFKYGFGPHISPIFGQSNFGVVTKMGFWLLPQPEASRSYVISVQRREEAVPLLDTMSYLVGSGLVDSTWNIGSPLLSANDDEVKAARAADAPVEEMERLGRAKNLGYWGMRLRFYDPVDVIDAKWRHVSKGLSAIPGFTFKEGKSYEFPLDPTTLEEPVDDAVIKPAFGIPNLAIFNRGGVNRSQGHVYFSPIIPMSGVEYLKAQTVFAAAFKELGLRPPSVTGGWSWFKRNLVLLTGMEITHDVESNRKLRAGYKRLVQISAENGWGEYRAAAAFMDDVMASFSFNNHALLRFHETLKDALDPNGILAPGKSGIWPKHLRGDRA